MIHKLEVKKLNGRFDYKFGFHPDINLFTGHIGTGKTTLLNLIWFLTTGSLHRVISEIPFDFVSIDTSEFDLSMEYVNPNQVKLILSFTKVEDSSESLLALKRYPSGDVVLKQQNAVDEPNKKIASAMDDGLFFPTFRRMERNIEKDMLQGNRFSRVLRESLSKLQDALSALADTLSVGDHKFVVAPSTYDISQLLMKKKTEIDKGKGADDFDHETLVQRWNMLNELVNDIYKDYDGIRMIDDIVLGVDTGKTGNHISSLNLSSGEKQLLGFLCYNAFSASKHIFIDEPELSLHPDWQRLLIPVLQYQGTEKQFFIASHSPYIGMKYDDNEFPLMKEV